MGERMLIDRRIPLISATGSTAMGKRVAEVVGKRLAANAAGTGRQQRRDRDAGRGSRPGVRAVSVRRGGTAGQRCTTHPATVRAHDPIAGELTERLVAAYKQVRIGIAAESETLVGPLINETAVGADAGSLALGRRAGRRSRCGGRRCSAVFRGTGAGSGPAEMPLLQVRNVRADSVSDRIRRFGSGDRTGTTVCRKGCLRRFSRKTCAQQRRFSALAAATAVSRT